LPQTLRFGVFELDPLAGELRKKGMKIRLQGQPVDMLVMLLQRPGETVTREELQKKLWPTDTFVDFEQGLNNAMKRLRAALDDDAESPRFIETVLCLTKMPFNLRRLLFATQTDGLERFPRMCRSSDRMIELQSNARPPQPSWGDRLQRVARTLRGDRFGPFRRRFAGSDGADRRPAAALRLVPFPGAQSSAVRASPFPTRDGFSIGDSKQNRKQEYDAVTLR
jgi:hypothetical protein